MSNIKELNDLIQDSIKVSKVIVEDNNIVINHPNNHDPLESYRFVILNIGKNKKKFSSLDL